MNFSPLSILPTVMLGLLSVHPVSGLDPVEVDQLANVQSSKVPFFQMRKSFADIAITKGSTVQALVTELQEISPDYAAELVRDQDFWKLAFLLENGWDIAKFDSQLDDLLRTSLREGHEPVVELVLKYGGWRIVDGEKNAEILDSVGISSDRLREILDSWESPRRGVISDDDDVSFNVDGVSRAERARLADEAGPSGAAPTYGFVPDYALVEVPFATNRASDSRHSTKLGTSKGAASYFSANPGDRLAYGFARVSIPQTHQEGKLEEKGLLEFRDDPKKHIILQGLSVTQRSDFFARIDELLSHRDKAFSGPLEKEDIMVYVHGFNVDFKYAMRRTAQLMYDLDFPGVSISYTWPAKVSSVPMPGDFKRDVQSARLSVNHFKGFLSDVSRRYPGRKIHIVAHSLGTRLVSESLVALAQAREAAVDGNKMALGELILAAPAIDARVFVSDWAPALNKIAGRVSVFASDDDYALKVQTLAEGDQFSFPLGLWDVKSGHIALADKVTHFDLSNLTTGTFSLDHSVYSDVPSAINHIGSMLRDSPDDAQMLGLDYMVRGKGVDFFSKRECECWSFLSL